VAGRNRGSSSAPTHAGDGGRGVSFAERLHAPGPLYSGLMMIPDPSVASVLGNCGLDFVTVDGEHGEYTPDALRACVATLKAVPTPVVIRTRSNAVDAVRQVLELGIDGLLVPRVEIAEQTAALVRVADGAATIVILENRLGIHNATSIAEVAGLDGIISGPSDLSHDLGVPGEIEHPTVRDAVEEVTAIALAAGLRTSPWREPRSDAERDSMLVFVFADIMLLTDAAKSAVDAARR
jgi:4-hydroxy-2-oxoheptanedioate aldolase